jgi:hypothetical protein
LPTSRLFLSRHIEDGNARAGTTEAAALLRSFGVRACIVDFTQGQQPPGPPPPPPPPPPPAHTASSSSAAGGVVGHQQQLVDWIWRYFTAELPPTHEPGPSNDLLRAGARAAARCCVLFGGRCDWDLAM